MTRRRRRYKMFLMAIMTAEQTHSGPTIHMCPRLAKTVSSNSPNENTEMMVPNANKNTDIKKYEYVTQSQELHDRLISLFMRTRCSHMQQASISNAFLDTPSRFARTENLRSSRRDLCLRLCTSFRYLLFFLRPPSRSSNQ